MADYSPEYNAKYDVLVQGAELPCSVRAFVVERMGCRVIVINAALSREARARALRHELRHLKRGDLKSRRPVSSLERETP